MFCMIEEIVHHTCLSNHVPLLEISWEYFGLVKVLITKYIDIMLKSYVQEAKHKNKAQENKTKH